MAWCRQATSHYLSQCWLRSMSPYGVTRPQLVNCITSPLCGVSSNLIHQHSLETWSGIIYLYGLWNNSIIDPEKLIFRLPGAIFKQILIVIWYLAYFLHNYLTKHAWMPQDLKSLVQVMAWSHQHMVPVEYPTATSHYHDYLTQHWPASLTLFITQYEWLQQHEHRRIRENSTQSVRNLSSLPPWHWLITFWFENIRFSLFRPQTS